MANHPATSVSCDPTTGQYDERLGAGGLVWAGRVERVFGHAAVVRPETEGESVTLLHPEQDLVPFGIQVPWSRIRPAAGERVRLEGRKLSLVDRLGRARVVGLVGEGISLRLLPVHRGCRRALGTQLRRVQVPARTRTLLWGTPVPAGSVQRAECGSLRSGLDRLVEDIRAGASRPGVVDLVGLGSGATPSGDDLLAGACAAVFRFSACGWLPADTWKKMQASLAGLDGRRTTRVGWEMIEQAAQGFFAQPLLAVVRLLGMPGVELQELERAVRRLAAVGRQSGADMLAGALALAREEQEETDD